MTTDYQRWATQHALQNVQLVQVLEFIHPAWSSSLWVSDYGVPFNATTEAAVAFLAAPVAFTIELPTSGASTQQQLTIKMDALGGQLVQTVLALTDAQRQQALKINYRVYLDTEPAAPCLDPLAFILLDVSSTRIVAQLNCASTVLPNMAAGIRYTMDKFPTLAYL